MPDAPKPPPAEKGFTTCPYCTIQIPESVPVCLHCQQVVRRPDRPGGAGAVAGVIPKAAALWDRYGRWVKLAGPVLLALLVFFLAYQRWAAQRVRIVPNTSLPVHAYKERKGDALVLRGAVTNRGEDVPDLSLKSIGVIAEFVYRDGRRERRTIFPKNEFRGEGALLQGETGRFEVEVPAEGLQEIVLRSEVVDLGMGRKLIPPRGR